MSALNPRLGSRAFCSAGPRTERITRTLPHALLHPGRDWLFSRNSLAGPVTSRFEFWCCSSLDLEPGTSLGSHVVVFLFGYYAPLKSPPSCTSFRQAVPSHTLEDILSCLTLTIIATCHSDGSSTHPAGGPYLTDGPSTSVFKPINCLTVSIARRADSESVDCAPSFSSFLPSGPGSLG
ncbi:uncharacterized protein LACBIDRAFT_330372 [Laccaria bicolor S238N-H82]|uniref:Predicted protein n=1 Tax=Laccaria bicolor (strain S238N-H82 / ATCC MYA-4686) TaxID=486041 RepID=B0DL37_LACBS|nr:uncharacterized protein LACBIDRAFT_330372 [Laccaria bicolor S238N-H82]EDR04759.1 predicted protein [Laccaria bicolor S238N-H82]|eukprot:XP_001884583.1 predicted protein [Laccaria bicolor S238N-H82]